MRIFSVLVTMRLNALPAITGTSLSPSRVKVSLKVAANALCKRGGKILSKGISANSRSAPRMVLPGAKMSAFCTNGPSGYSSASANSVATMLPIRIVFPAPMASARM